MLWLLTACACMICFAPVIATYSPLSMSEIPKLVYRSIRSRRSPLLALLVADVDDGLRLLVGRGNDLRIGLEGALRGDHVDQLRGQIHVGAFQRSGLNAAEAGGSRNARHDRAGGESFRPVGV